MITYSYALKEIGRRKSRTIVNIAGFTIGVAALVTLVMGARGWEALTAGPLRALGADMIFFYPAPIAPAPGVGCYIVMHLFSYPFDMSIGNHLVEVPGVERAVPVVLHRNLAVTLCGIDPTETVTNVILPSDVIEGRYLAPDDKDVALVDSQYAAQHGLKVGSTVTYVKDFKVVGIVKAKAMSLIQATIYANLRDVQETVGGPGKINIVLIRAEDPRKISSIVETISRSWPRSTVFTASDIARVTTGVINIGEQTAWSISLILIVVTVLFGIKSQLSALVERTREIGLLKAIGWSNKDVVSQMVIESLLQGLIGGLIGCIAGYAASLYVLSTIKGEMGEALQLVNVDPLLLATGMTISVLSSLLAGIYPALKATKLTPAEALRTI